MREITCYTICTAIAINYVLRNSGFNFQSQDKVVSTLLLLLSIVMKYKRFPNISSLCIDTPFIENKISMEYFFFSMLT